MRNPAYILIILVIILSGCTTEVDSEPDVPNTPEVISPATQFLDLDYEIIAVSETRRFSPPGDVRWLANWWIGTNMAWTRDSEDYNFFAIEAGGRLREALGMPVYDPEDDLYEADLVTWNPDTGEIELERYEPPLDRHGGWVPFLAWWGPSDLPFKSIFTVPGAPSKVSSYYVDPESEAYGGREYVPHPIFERINIYSGNLLVSELDLAEKELSSAPTSILFPLNTRDNCAMVLESLVDIDIEQKDGTMKLVPEYYYIGNINGGYFSMEYLAHKTGGAELTGFTVAPDVFFFEGESPDDTGLRIYIGYEEEMITLDLSEIESGIEITEYSPYDPLRIDGRIPAVSYGDNTIVFATTEVESHFKIYTAAIMIDRNPHEGTEPVVLWKSELPNIFKVPSSMLTVNLDSGTGERPYIVTLEPRSGEFAIFDPLTGSIRHQSVIELEDWHTHGHFASIIAEMKSAEHSPGSSQPIFIHDPNANEIIQLEISIGDSEGPSITPLRN